MILKIEDKCKMNEENNVNNSWWIYGELDKCHHFIVETEEDKRFHLYDLCLVNSSKDYEDGRQCLAIRLRFINGKEMSIIISKGINCYLCNNEGKTIDKITC